LSLQNSINFVSGTATPGAYIEKRNPFNTHYDSNPTSTINSQVAVNHSDIAGDLLSRRRKKGEIERPWLASKNPKEKWITIIPIIGMLVGLGVGALMV